MLFIFFFFFQAEDGIRDYKVTGVQTCALPISARTPPAFEPGGVRRIHGMRAFMWSRNELPPCAISISPQLQQALNGRAIDDEPRRSKRRPSEPGQESAFNQTQNLKLLAQLGAVT